MAIIIGAFVAWRNGARPKNKLTTADTTRVKSSTFACGAKPPSISAQTARNHGLPGQQKATPMPRRQQPVTCFQSAVAGKSGYNCQPAANRKLNSRCLALFLASSSVVTFTHAISNTRLTNIIRTITPLR